MAASALRTAASARVDLSRDRLNQKLPDLVGLLLQMVGLAALGQAPATGKKGDLDGNARGPLLGVTTSSCWTFGVFGFFARYLIGLRYVRRRSDISTYSKYACPRCVPDTALLNNERRSDRRLIWQTKGKYWTTEVLMKRHRASLSREAITLSACRNRQAFPGGTALTLESLPIGAYWLAH